jgi:hypothetical protein
VRVTNEDERPRRWNVEPYGDDFALLPNDSLTVEVESGPDVLIEVGLHPDRVGDVLWIYVDGEPAVPSDLKVNDRSVWSPQ